MEERQLKKERNSNIELFRIIMILVVIAHHYVVNSNIQSFYQLNHVSANMVFMQIFGCGGKIAINCFLIISGYFMCKQEATMYRWLKLFLEWLFYNVVINTIFIIAGYKPLGMQALLTGFFPFLGGVGTGRDLFMFLFLYLFLLVPFLNKLIHAMNRREYTILLGILLFLFTILSTFYFHKTATGWATADHWEGLGWYATAYLIGGYIRLYPPPNLDTLRAGLILSVISILCVCGSIVLADFIDQKYRIVSAYHMVYGCNKFLAVTCAISLFLLFKNINIKNSIWINRISSTTFGVLLIHANSDTMRRFLWMDLFQNGKYYSYPFWKAVSHAVCTVLIVYVICVGIDLLRQYTVERWLLRKLGRSARLTRALYTKPE